MHHCSRDAVIYLKLSLDNVLILVKLDTMTESRILSKVGVTTIVSLTNQG